MIEASRTIALRETSRRTRSGFDADEGSRVLVHLTVRWDDVDDRYWGERERGIGADLARMKRLVETESIE